jgi:hypothetical protein
VRACPIRAICFARPGPTVMRVPARPSCTSRPDRPARPGPTVLRARPDCRARPGMTVVRVSAPPGFRDHAPPGIAEDRRAVTQAHLRDQGKSLITEGSWRVIPRAGIRDQGLGLDHGGLAGLVRRLFLDHRRLAGWSGR